MCREERERGGTHSFFTLVISFLFGELFEVAHVVFTFFLGFIANQDSGVEEGGWGLGLGLIKPSSGGRKSWGYEERTENEAACRRVFSARRVTPALEPASLSCKSRLRRRRV